MSRRVAAYDEEPASFDATDIVKFLERHGRPGFAEFVRHIDRRTTAHNRELAEMRDHANSLLKRLHKYEPPPPGERFSCKPPPEASD